MPLYHVKMGEGETLKESLVEANNQAAARNFAVRDTVKVEAAKPADIHRLALAGVPIQVATGADDAEVQEQAGSGESQEQDEK